MRGVQLSRRTTESFHINDVGTAIELYTIQGRSKASGIWNYCMTFTSFFPQRVMVKRGFFWVIENPWLQLEKSLGFFGLRFLKFLNCLASLMYHHHDTAIVWKSRPVGTKGLIAQHWPRNLISNTRSMPVRESVRTLPLLLVASKIF